jgi:Icc-related predicted phosphoesterase
MKILALSDRQVPFVYSPQARRRFKGVEVIVGCGDLDYYYLEYILTVLDAVLFFVRGNHDRVVEYSSSGARTYPHGATDLHRKVCCHQGLLLAGVEGSLRYKSGPFQYSQSEMWGHVLSLAPRLLANRLRYGRYLDIFVTHAPPAGIHDADDLPHQGIRAFRWLLTVFHPAYHLHGHIHVLRPGVETETQIDGTCVINCFPYRELEIETQGAQA